MQFYAELPEHSILDISGYIARQSPVDPAKNLPNQSYLAICRNNRYNSSP
jgi:hypothetical protein